MPYDAWFGPDAFDATYGYDQAALLTVGASAEPAGFAGFWTTLYERALAVDPAPASRPVPGRPGWHDVEFTSLDGVRLGGWLWLPPDRVERAVVVGHGYGGREEPDPGLALPGTAVLFAASRGLPMRGLVPGIPAVSAEHVLHGIASAETYVHGGSAADVWCAASALLALLPEPPDRVAYAGASFGGGIGALALPWDDRFDRGALTVPSFGNHDLRLTMPCTGSGEAVRLHVARHPAAREVLRFFDAATAARRLRIPMLVAPALWDPAVPPPGQFAVHNAIPGPKQLVVLAAGHAEYPDQPADDARLGAALRSFLLS
ncbi:acetylxylan esterase [Jiangella aurantiaca]|uniref:Acetylxylan esterase n=1 Tax=Jiangella aurantiaca TaxID=2530373 RepID=A0A4R4ZZ44_9ACTN|nr:acetylxylan esterase [Jiangella aurantiaca]TDD64613.1 acetylxylan esterase [Jiangella aurantiaca]